MYFLYPQESISGFDICVCLSPYHTVSMLIPISFATKNRIHFSTNWCYIRTRYV